MKKNEIIERFTIESMRDLYDRKAQAVLDRRGELGGPSEKQETPQIFANH
jgi:hypothetical protein